MASVHKSHKEWVPAQDTMYKSSVDFAQSIYSLGALWMLPSLSIGTVGALYRFPGRLQYWRGQMQECLPKTMFNSSEPCKNFKESHKMCGIDT